MKSMVGKAALAAVLVMGSGAALAGVTVNYVDPQNYSDLPSTEWEREDVLRELVKFFDKLGKDLPAGHDFTVNITNIDMAGREVPGRRATGDMRMMEGQSDWPVIQLSYTLSAKGQVIDSGQAEIRDMGYLNRMMKRSQETDRLRFEKRMLQDWFKKTILSKTSA